MIEDYIQTISEKVIKNKDFLLVNNARYWEGYTKKRVFFMKNCGSNFVLLEIYNLAEYEEDELENEISEKKENLQKILNSPVEYKIFKVFISDFDVSDKTIDLIKSIQVHDVSIKKFVNSIYINLNNDEVNCYFDRNFPDGGIVEVLIETLDNKNWSKYDENRIFEIDREKQKDYRVSIVSVRSIAVYTIIALNVLVYIVAKMKCYENNVSYFEVMKSFGIMDGDLIKKGEYFRLLSPVFLHGGIIHLFINCYSLMAIGPICEKMYGNLKFLIIYLLSGIGGFIFSFALTKSLSLGASGAIFGIVGALLYFGVQKPVAFKAMFGTFLIGVTILNLAFGFCVDDIDNFGHIGGLIAGFLLAGILRYSKEDRFNIRSICLIILTVIFGGLLHMGLR